MSAHRSDSQLDPPSQTEIAVFGSSTSAEIRAYVESYVRHQLSDEVACVRFRAGRIDAVWGVDLADGRAVVIKVHRPPSDLDALRATADAQRVLAEASFPCPIPQAEPQNVEGHVVTAEMLVAGSVPDGRNPDVRQLLADGLARHIRLLQARPDLS